MTLSELSISEVAQRLGVIDALVFRRVSRSTWAHLGGFGRGNGWAGIIDLDESADPVMADLPAAPGAVVYFAHESPEHVLGPYYAVAGALIRVSGDVVVVVGNPTAPIAAADDDAFRALATMVDRDVQDVTPAKRLADELEVLNAVRAIITSSASNLTDTLRHILAVALESLSCEVGALCDGQGHVVSQSRCADEKAIHNDDRDEASLVSHLETLQTLAAGRSLRLQYLDPQIRARLGLSTEIKSLLVVPIPAPCHGVIVAGHTSCGPRGFTDLCERLGEQVADAAGIIGHSALLRDHLGTAVDEHSRAARTDALTGLGNRLLWDEALVDAQRLVDAGSAVTVITLDLDGLKRVNDNHGHSAGDDLLRRCADILRSYCRDDDIAVRLGGDEFALLLPIDSTAARRRRAALIERFSLAVDGTGSVEASVGAGTATAGQRVADVLRAADAAMYANKRSRRLQRRGAENTEMGTQQNAAPAASPPTLRDAG